VRRALLAALLVYLHGPGMACAQDAWSAPEPIVNEPNSDPNARCSLFKKYCPIKFESFLFEANYCEGGFIREFKCALTELVRWKCEGAFDTTIPGYRVTRVTAPPGYGKSALLRYLNDILKTDSEVRGTRPDEIRDILRKDRTFDIQKHMCTIKLDELGSRFAVHSTMLDELKNDDGFPMPAFAKLRAFDYDDHAAPGVEFLVRAFNPAYSESKLDQLILVIDSIDEIHPESAKSLLKRIDEYIKQREEEDKGVKRVEPAKRGFLRVFVLGRPEGFTDYYRITQGGVPKTEPVKLKDPCYRSDDDLVAAAKSVVQFSILGGGEDLNSEAIKSMSINAINFMKKHPWLNECRYNLSAFNELVKVSNDYAKPPRSLADDFQLKEIFFHSLLARARDSHNRPVSRSQDYVKLLEKIASKFARNVDVDKDPYFSVTPSDFVEIEVKVGRGTHTISYLVESALNRSGVADLDSEHLYVPRYRFYPSWVREHLLRRRQKRQEELAKKGNTTRSCAPHCPHPACCP